MGWNNGDYSAITTLTDSDLFLASQGGVTQTATLAKIRSALGICSSCVLSSDSTLAGTPANTTETTLFSYVLPAATLSTDGWFIRIIAWGYTGASGNNKSLLVRFGGTAIISSGMAALNNNTWFLEAYVIRKAAGNQDAIGRLTATPVANGWGGTVTGMTLFSEPAINLNGAVTIVINGLNGVASASDVTYEGSLILLNS